MPHTHKKTIKNQNQEKGSSLKIKQRRRRMMGGVQLVRANSFVSTNSAYESGPENEGKNSAPSALLEPEKEVSNIVTEVVFPTNTSFVKSNLNYNPFYSKKSSDVVENKKIYNFDTNYILEEIEKLQSKDRNFMITSDIISQILKSKPKSHDEIFVDYKRQQELHRDLCDFD